jgi:SIT family siderophore-iron:H+ symporter-like MFS transporter
MSSIDSHSPSATKPETETDVRAHSSEDAGSEHVPVLGKKSPGVVRIEAINAHLTSFDRWFLGIGVFLIAYAYGLDGTVRYTYQVSFGVPSAIRQISDLVRALPCLRLANTLYFRLSTLFALSSLLPLSLPLQRLPTSSVVSNLSTFPSSSTFWVR